LLVMTATRKAETTKVLDLAAGHGGFAITVAEAARRRGLNIEITASDLKAEYLEIGRRELERRNSEARVSFVVQDALDLTNLTRGQYDIITSTQSLHHFSPGVVVAMMRAAAQWAGGGVLFVDGCRSALTGLGLAFYGAVAETNLSFVHDGLISSRKFFMPQELELLARLACPSLSNDQISARWLPPGYCLVKMERW